MTSNKGAGGARWPEASHNPLDDVRETIGLMRARLEEGIGTEVSAMCRLSLPMSEWLLDQLDLVARVHDETLAATEKYREVLDRQVTALMEVYADAMEPGQKGLWDELAAMVGLEGDHGVPHAHIVGMIGSTLEAQAEALEARSAGGDIELFGEFAGLGLTSPGPHRFTPDDCPTFHDGCNCTVETLTFNIDRAERAQAKVAEWEANVDALQELKQRQADDREAARVPVPWAAAEQAPQSGPLAEGVHAMRGYFVIEVPQGTILGAGWTYPASNGMHARIYLTFDAAKAQVDRLRAFSSKVQHRWAVVDAADWLHYPVEITPLYEELSRR